MYSVIQPSLMPSDISKNLLEELKKKVFEKRPILGRLFTHYGNSTLTQFTKYQYTFAQNPELPLERKQELIDVIKSNVLRKLGAAPAESITKQLEDHYFAITAYHHGPLTYPGYLGGNLLTSLFIKNSESKNMKNIFMLSCANVSFDNISFPRGLILHDEINGKEYLNQLVFFPRKVRPFSVVYNPAYTKDAIEQAYIRLDEWTTKEYVYKPKHAEKLKAIIEEIYATDSILAKKTYSEQVTQSNFNLWKKLMGESGGNLINLEQEEIVMELLLKYHMQQDTLINRLLFSKEYSEKIDTYFDGILSCFSKKNNYGTFLFWGFPNNERTRVQLWKQGDTLATLDGSFKVPLTAAGITQALLKKELVPSTLLSFFVLSFYYGLNLIGGMNQTTYLPQMQEALTTILTDVKDTKEIPLISSVKTIRQCFTRLHLAFLENSLIMEILASTIDMLLYGNPDFLDTIKNIADTTTIGQALTSSLPEIYRLVVPLDEQTEELLSLTYENIDAINGFSKKIQYVGKID